MQHSQAYYKELLSGFTRNTLTSDEVKELYLFIDREPEMYKQLMSDPDLIDLMEQSADRTTAELQPAADDRIWQQLRAHTGSKVRVVSMSSHRRWGWVAAAVILFAGIATALIISYNHRGSVPSRDVAARPLSPDVKAPRTNRATITLAGGKQVALDSLAKGVLAWQGNVKLVKLDDGQVAYQSVSGEILRESVQNTLYNPRGSKVVDMALSDGSHVWLNAGSSITYPVAFSGKERKVAITGEAYFEVFHDADRPFYVRKGNMEVKVLGTHFNVNAFDDEAAIKVTLLQGSVRVMNSVTLRPGQQAVVATTGGKSDEPVTIVANPNLEAVMAWKDGLFNFNKVPLQDVMRQLARWYDVDVEYQGTVTTKTLGGEMQRDLNLSEVLDGLRDIGVHFRIEQKKVIVMP